MTKIKAIILANETTEDHILWVKACTIYNTLLDFRVVDLTKNNWLDEIQSKPFDILLTKPGGLTSPFKSLYDERVYILERTLKYKLFPSAEEIFIYENKRFLSFWLKANHIPHPATDVYYAKKEAFDSLNSYNFPIVGKVNIGASGSGVRILKTKPEAITYINETFSGKGAPKRSGPNFEKGGIIKRGLNYLAHPRRISKKLILYNAVKNDVQKDFVIFQEFIQHDYEWRVVRIGESFFAHKKLKVGEKASGSLLKNYDNPPLTLFDFVKQITDKHDFYSQAVDVFELKSGKYLVNEMQCFFGQSDPYQMMLDKRPGRYIFLKENWQFEEGAFNNLECYDLRIQHILELLNNGN